LIGLQLATLDDNRRYKALTQPITQAEKGSATHLPRDGGAAFFGPRKTPPKAMMTTVTSVDQESLTPIDFCKAVTNMVLDPAFAEKHKGKAAPLAMIAFANEVAEKIIQKKKTNDHFDGLVMEVPSLSNAQEEFDNPHYHSIIGTKLLYVDWTRSHGVSIPCPDATCKGILQNDRTNNSKNKTLYPIFSLYGAPSWCIVMTMTCGCCRRRHDANDGEILVNLPDHVAQTYPVESQYAFNNFASHLSRSTTEVFSSIMLTYGNGELCSKLLYNAINRAYILRVTAYYSKATTLKKNPANYVERNGVFIKTYPPLGDTIRDMFDAASSSRTNPWRVSDFDRHTREIQGVSCNGVFAQDHTFEAIKNYQKRVGAKAAWTVGTGTGEIACVALVPTTKTKDFSHAAAQLMRRHNFNPKVMYSDTWPNKNLFWSNICPDVEGRLGLFHFEKRIISTLRKKHIDCYDAITDLLNSLYVYHAPDYERLLAALKEGTLSSTGHKYTSDEIADLKSSRLFRDRYSKYLRKKLHSTQTIVQNLDDWHCKYKVTSSDADTRPARGRLDPIRLVSLFTPETKDAVENCKKKAVYLSDPLPLDEIYDEIPANPNSKHQLTEYISKRGESKLESFHDRFAHFANCGMRDTLADSLNLAGTARYNLTIRHKRLLVTTKNPPENPHHAIEKRKRIPAGWEKVVPFFNHTELGHVNGIAQSAGCHAPFPEAEVLPKDNGERFFSLHMETLKQIGTRRGDHGECLCQSCSDTSANNKPMDMVVAPPINNTQNTTTTGNQNQNQTVVAPQPTKIHARNTTPTATSLAESVTYERVRAPATPTTLPIFPRITPYPFFYHPPLNLYHMTPPVAVPVPCCLKCKEWLKVRVGRPPHHPLCHNR